MRFHPFQLISVLVGFVLMLYWLHPTHHDMAVMYELSGMPYESLDHYRDYIEKHPEDRDARRAEANLLRYLGENEEAVDALVAIKEIDPDDLQARREMIQIYYDTMSIDKVIREREELARWLEKHKRTPEYERMLWEEYQALVNMYSFKGDGDKSVRLRYRMVQAAPFNEQMLIDYVAIVLQVQPVERFGETATMIANRFPGNLPLAQRAMALSLYSRSYDQSIELSRIFLKYHPDDWILWYYDMKAHRLAALRDDSQWEAYVSRILDAYAKFGDAAPAYDVILETMDKGKFELARQALERWRAMGGGRRDAWNMMLYTYADRAGIPPEKQYDMYYEAMLQFPEDSQLKTDVGWLAIDLQKWSVAATIWQDLLKGDSGNVDIHAALLEALSHLGDSDSYTMAVRQALLRFPENRELRENLGWQYQNRSDWIAAAEQWGILWQQEPTNQGFFDNYVYALSQTHDPQAIEKALREHPEWHPLREKLAYMRQDENDWPAAARVWGKLWEENPRSAEYYQNYMYCLTRAGDTATLSKLQGIFTPVFAEDQYLMY